ncbi:bifunctional phosphopantothenoylcysteine decarboxylase/phosphopantothenate--cysteine ligase CoaBC [Geobacter sp.]|uniref:bifunctional phosphopantothenoylcysteine decarboxylase/phosphopantothenate--cysteine ligase CoaBC n=1 Tax=Geobacter sp. TaxID=46610 RepID=UPI001AD01994|nr:bifunctional phosphopantothenoylcysteine decarboxylase/phosphopantothenate--cysteine ligase CoaBC [Geobacter sp.]CAG0979870.1 phosphopantothenoylcysteine decarboxylase / phosphopantothenate---cysteine ligase [Geobacteraceae bacterium]
MLNGKQIVLGVTGGIAVYKAVELVRLLTKAGADVHVIMTRSATEFVGPLTFQTLTANPVHTEIFNLIAEREIGHIALADRADLFIIAPATANVIGKIANGIADDMLTTTVMATRAPVLIAPAMNVNMCTNPLYQENEEKLRRHGYRFVAPVKGMLACGWEGEGKLQDPAVIVEEAVRSLTRPDLAGERVLVTAGPTLEEIDPVRFVSNHSSGKMGYAIARAARRRGAEVVLVAGPTCLDDPWGIETIHVCSAAEMRDAVMERVAASTVIVKAAAVADYRPRSRAAGKIKKSADALVLELEKNPDILAEVGGVKGDRVLVGFAAETGELVENARKKLTGKNLDLVVANDIGQPGAGFHVDTNIAKLIHRDGRVEELPLMGKDKMATLILDRVAELRKRGMREEE